MGVGSCADTQATIEDLIAAGESQTRVQVDRPMELHTQQRRPEAGARDRQDRLRLPQRRGRHPAHRRRRRRRHCSASNDDFTTLGSKRHIDGYELFLRQLLDTNLSGQHSCHRTNPVRESVGATSVVVSVAASGKPVFAKPPKGTRRHQEFWVRIGNATKQLHGDDMVEYHEQPLGLTNFGRLVKGSSKHDTAMAPPGMHAASAYAYAFPVETPRDQHGHLKNEMADRVVDKISRYAPNFKDIRIRVAVTA